MKTILTSVLSIILSVTLNATVTIIPKPNSMNVNITAEPFVINKNTKILVEKANNEALNVAEFLHSFLSIQLPGLPNVEEELTPRVVNTVLFTTKGADKNLGEEGYTLMATKDSITIRATGRKGLFWGLQTLRQLLPERIEMPTIVHDVSWTVPDVSIIDKPVYKYRGCMLDVSRTFFGKEYIKHYIDILSLYKNNVLHLHLTDDQGWRIESKKYPQLHLKGSVWHETAPVKIGAGYYTQEDIKEIVAYALERNVNILPEIDLPAHSCALMHAMPELATNQPRHSSEFKILPFQESGIYHHEPICPVRSYSILDTIIKEVSALFPFEYFHLGGDEVQVVDAWNRSADVANLKKTEGLTSNKQVEAYFSKKMEQILKKYNKKMVTWNEANSNSANLPTSLQRFKLDTTSVMMQWANPDGATFNNKYILAAYGDLYYDIIGKGSISPYNFDPTHWLETRLKRKITEKEKDNLMGMTGAMWTHIDRTELSVQSAVFPNQIALSETNWTQVSLKNFDDFKRRLAHHNERLEIINSIYYKKPIQAKGPIALFTFDKTSNTVVYDSLNNHNAIISSASIISNDGYVGKGLDMTKNGSKMFIKDTIQIEGDWAISLWIKINGHKPYSFLTTSTDGMSGLRIDQYGTNNKVGFTRKGVADYSFNYTLPVHVWKHLTFVRDLDSTRLFIDGELMSVVPFVIDAPMHSIGSSDSKFPEVINGIIDNLMFFKGSLSPIEVQMLYNGSYKLNTRTTSKKLEMSIHPNPFYDLIYIESDSNLDNILINVYNTAGVKINLPVLYHKDNIRINSSSLNAGIYVVSVSNKKELVEHFMLVKPKL
jgi:N-acetyl-beta-hexosaminidase